MIFMSLCFLMSIVVFLFYPVSPLATLLTPGDASLQSAAGIRR